jgi:hypothetical protein
MPPQLAILDALSLLLESGKLVPTQIVDTYLHTHAMANTDDTWGGGLPTVGERTWG